jgi:hypothetical protein
MEILEKSLTQRLVTQVFSDAEDEDLLHDELNDLTRRGLRCTVYQVLTAAFVFAENRI